MFVIHECDLVLASYVTTEAWFVSIVTLILKVLLNNVINVPLNSLVKARILK